MMKDSNQLSVVSCQKGGGEEGAGKYFFRASAADFKKIPGNPIAYWASSVLADTFLNSVLMANYTPPKKGLDTGNNDMFLRLWYEPSIRDINVPFISEDVDQDKKWRRYNKGGTFRKWFGNNIYLVNWENDGAAIRSYSRSTIRNEKYLGKYSLCWSDVTSSSFSARLSGEGALHDNSGPCAFGESIEVKSSLAFLCSKLSNHYLPILNPTLHYQIGNVASLPINSNLTKDVISTTDLAVNMSKLDWDSYETSWDFSCLPLLHTDYRQLTLKATNQKLFVHWHKTIQDIQRLEGKNNRIFIKAYGLQDELTPEVPLNEITLTCNPHYRYKGNKTEEELEALLLADTMKEFLSYSVGCMFGRYSLDAPGLILANQGETLEDYYKKITSYQLSVASKSTDKTDNCTLHTENFQNTFLPDKDNVIPILDGQWFADDITQRFGAFLKITFGEEHYEENLKFITDAIGKDIRKYFLKDFYKDHLKTYKKRPIYWLFSSPKGSFNALIYMHRYSQDTVSIILNDYLREFRTKLINAQENLEQVSISADATKPEKTKALKQIEKLKKTIVELDTYENETLYPLATQNIEINLDDGVKVNYKKFGKALKKVPGLS